MTNHTTKNWKTPINGKIPYFRVFPLFGFKTSYDSILNFLGNFSMNKKVTLVSKHYFKHFFCDQTLEIYPGLGT